MLHYVEARDLAELAGLTNRAVEKAIGLVLTEGRLWRGAALIVRQVPGRGGRSGWRYQVRVDSLPEELQLRWQELQRPIEGRLSQTQLAQRERNFWYGLIAPILSTPKHSKERGALVRETAARRHARWDGQAIQVTERSLQRKLDAFERTGSMAALGRTKRIDAGEKRFSVSTRWDKAVPFAEEKKDEIGRELRRQIGGLMAAGEHGEMLKTFSARWLAQRTRDAGFDAPDLLDLCAIPDNLVQELSAFRKVAQFHRDRKAHEDLVRPRVQRTRPTMPMEIVVGDVHPIDIACLRPDGSTVYPKAIGWFDVATNRVLLDVLFMEPGKSIRNADVISSFTRMCREWGLPARLYLDNGSEYNWAEFINDAMRLLDASGRADGAVSFLDDRVSRIIRARPYNAAAKPIEGIFGVLERNYFSAIPGWVGGDRMNKKTASVGRKVEPFAGSYDELRGHIADNLQIYNSMPQKRGGLKGLSPFGAFRKAVQDGWTMRAVEDGAFAVAFSEPVVREVRQGTIRHGGRRWGCDALDRYVGDRVTILVPKFEDPSCLFLQSADGKPLGVAEPMPEFDYRDPAGAREADRRGRQNRAAIKSLARAVPTVDRTALHADLAAHPPQPDKAPIGATITASAEAQLVNDHLTTEPATRVSNSIQKRKREDAERTQLMRELTRKLLEGEPE